MKKLTKFVTVATLAAVCTVSVSALVGCGGGETDVSGTYTLTISDKDLLSMNNYGSNFFAVVAGDNAYLKDTLILNADGTYSLNKYTSMDATAAAGEDIWLSYTYYGTYTNDGYTVTLSACTSVDWQEYWTAALSSYCPSGSGTGITDSAATSSTGLTIMGSIYSAYLNTSSYGNTAQDVTVSTDGSLTFIEIEEE